jgi:cobalt-zinc-cadmium efflux system outer membrane protein
VRPFFSGIRCALLGGLVGAWLAGVAMAAVDEHAAEHLHVPLEPSPALAWPELIQTTLEHYPRFVELAARAQEASALAGRGRSWLSGPPSISTRYQTDDPYDNVSLREYELGLNLPLWRLGQRRAAGSLGAAASTSSDAAASALRHEVIGLLRMVLWDIELAVNDLAVAREGARVANALEAVIERQYEAGEIALSETFLVRSTAMEREAAVIESEAALVDAELVYQSLTGLNIKPSQFAESLTDREVFDDSHPALLLADAELERARAALDLAQRTAKGSPVLTIGPRRERASFSSYDADSLGVTLTLPFGGRSYANAAAAPALRAVAAAEADRLQMLRELELELSDARHTFSIIEEALALAEQRSALATRGFEMGQQAFAQGEMTLLELLRTEEIAVMTQREVVGFEAERQRAIARINQAVGVWP